MVILVVVGIVVIAALTAPLASLTPTRDIGPLIRVMAFGSGLRDIRNIRTALSATITGVLLLRMNDSRGALITAGSMPAMVASQSGGGRAARLGLNGKTAGPIFSFAQAKPSALRGVRV